MVATALYIHWGSIDEVMAKTGYDEELVVENVGRFCIIDPTPEVPVLIVNKPFFTQHWKFFPKEDFNKFTRVLRHEPTIFEKRFA